MDRAEMLRMYSHHSTNESHRGECPRKKKTSPKMRRPLPGGTKVVLCGKIEEGKPGWRGVTGQTSLCSQDPLVVW